MIKLINHNFKYRHFQNDKNREVEVDIDELLDMDNDEHRRNYLQVRF